MRVQGTLPVGVRVSCLAVASPHQAKGLRHGAHPTVRLILAGPKPSDWCTILGTSKVT